MAHLKKQVDMSHRIARIFEPLLRLLLPARGRHRVAASVTAATFVPPPPPPPVPPAWPFLRGEDSPLVRPYLRVHELRELREEARLQRQRRRDLWFALYGIDLDTRDIHGLGVS
ncbi:hypothetical protein ABCR94_06600 [Streptomyces sp. 21So2-11]|uniref:hypothetical protein n=1 Tax=Streptomyces sp. 21So2-11 TaxID=3144408 RepID=UPI0032197F4A